MKTRILVACLAMLGASATCAATDEPIKPIVAAKVTNPALVELGKKLYFDPRSPSPVSFPATPAITCRWAAPTT